jgi:hypothetical protein
MRTYLIIKICALGLLAAPLLAPLAVRAQDDVYAAPSDRKEKDKGKSKRTQKQEAEDRKAKAYGDMDEDLNELDDELNGRDKQAEPAPAEDNPNGTGYKDDVQGQPDSRNHNYEAEQRYEANQADKYEGDNGNGERYYNEEAEEDLYYTNQIRRWDNPTVVYVMPGPDPVFNPYWHHPYWNDPWYGWRRPYYGSGVSVSIGYGWGWGGVGYGTGWGYRPWGWGNPYYSGWYDPWYGPAYHGGYYGGYYHRGYYGYTTKYASPRGAGSRNVYRGSTNPSYNTGVGKTTSGGRAVQYNTGGGSGAERVGTNSRSNYSSPQNRANQYKTTTPTRSASPGGGTAPSRSTYTVPGRSSTPSRTYSPSRSVPSRSYTPSQNKTTPTRSSAAAPSRPAPANNAPSRTYTPSRPSYTPSRQAPARTAPSRSSGGGGRGR